MNAADIGAIPCKQCGSLYCGTICRFTGQPRDEELASSQRLCPLNRDKLCEEPACREVCWREIPNG